MICSRPNATAATRFAGRPRALKHPPETSIWKLEAALYCEPCSEGRHYSRRLLAHILGLTYAGPAGTAILMAVPELTGSADIKLTRQLCLRGPLNKLTI